jgi:hypothetical protein
MPQEDPFMVARFADNYSLSRVDWSVAFAQPRPLGVRCMLELKQSGEVALTYHVSKVCKAKPAHILSQLSSAGDSFKLFTLSESVKFDGYLCYFHDDGLQSATTALLACHKQRNDTDRLKFVIADVVAKTNFRERFEVAKNFVGYMDFPDISCIDTVKVTSDTELAVTQQEFIRQGYTGVLLRHGAADYTPGKTKFFSDLDTFNTAEYSAVDYAVGRNKQPRLTLRVPRSSDLFFDAPVSLPFMKEIPELASLVGKRVVIRYSKMASSECVPLFPVAVRVAN